MRGLCDHYVVIEKVKLFSIAIIPYNFNKHLQMYKKEKDGSIDKFIETYIEKS